MDKFCLSPEAGIARWRIVQGSVRFTGDDRLTIAIVEAPSSTDGWLTGTRI